jgi:hypothetical protein
VNKPLSAEAAAERALMCRMPGCRNRWSVDVSHGKVCSQHDQQLAKADHTEGAQRARQFRATLLPHSLPTLREVARPFTEVDRDDEQEF